MIGGGGLTLYAKIYTQEVLTKEGCVYEGPAPGSEKHFSVSLAHTIAAHASRLALAADFLPQEMSPLRQSTLAAAAHAVRHLHWCEACHAAQNPAIFGLTLCTL